MPTYHMVKKRRASRKRNMPGMILRSSKTGRFVTGGFASRAGKTGPAGKRKGERKARILVARVPSRQYGERRSTTSLSGSSLKKLVAEAVKKAHPRRRRKPSAVKKAAKRVYKKFKASTGSIGLQARSANPRRRRRRGRRSNASHFRRRRRSNPRVFRVRRRNRGRARRRNPFGLSVPRVAGIFSKDTALQVVGAGAGFSASLWFPKLLGHGVWAPLGRGWGGVATSLVGVSVSSWAIGKVNAQAGRSAWIGGLVGVFASAVSAISCSLRQTILPFESSMLACALPAMPAAPNDAKAQLLQASIAARAGGNLALAEELQARAIGMSGYESRVPRGTANMLKGENADRGRRGLRDFVPGGTIARPENRLNGMGEFARFQRSATPVGMDSHGESF